MGNPSPITGPPIRTGEAPYPPSGASSFGFENELAIHACFFWLLRILKPNAVSYPDSG